jgi:hypothetical protein
MRRAKRVLFGLLVFGAAVSRSHGQLFGGRVDVPARSVGLHAFIDNTTNLVYLQLYGPSSNWFGWGFGSSTMVNTYAIIVDGSGNVTERKLGNHAAGTLLSATVTVLGTCETNGTTYVSCQRGLVGSNANYYTFTAATGTVNVIWAAGAGATLAYEGAGNNGSDALAKGDFSRPLITDAAIAGGAATLSFSGIVAGPSGSIESTSDLLGGSWTGISNPAPATPCGIPAYTLITNAVVTIDPATSAVYRLRY